MTDPRGADSSEYRPGSMAGKAVIVTGGTTGIGLATTQLLATEGARVC